MSGFFTGALRQICADIFNQLKINYLTRLGANFA